ncbi:MAG: glycosyltransferase [Ruminococcaceae bacterium]|nr:glycosyltransferase [Oscillospiraceae bacterium]
MFVISLVLQVLSLTYGAYYFLVSLFGWYNKKGDAKGTTDKTHTFALVVAAHNEEAVIANMVKSLNTLNYPREAYDIFVIADNCDDNTAAIAREAGALVYERTNTELRGKGYALEWMFEHIFNMEKHYDSISIFDADNLVNKEYLAEMNKELNKGYKVVQGYIDSKNPFDSWITSAYSISFWSISRLFQNARYNLGITCQLSGTGFVIDTDLLKRIGWKATCLTEDMEFTARLALENEKVGFAYHAVVYDEKPLTMAQSWRQRVRWMQGHADVCSRFCIKLLKQAFEKKDWSAFDCAIYLMNPLKIIMTGMITFMAWSQTFFPDGNLGFFQMYYMFESPLVWNIAAFVSFLYMPLVITIERKVFNKKLLWSYITYSIYSLTWVPITIQGCLNKNKKEWCHTQHTRQISIDEMEKIS